MANQGLSGTLKVGYLATQHINADCARVISLFEQKYQNINIIVQYENFKDLLNKLRRGEIDIAFTTTFEVEQETDLAYQEFVRVKNLLIVPDAYPLKRPELREKPHPALSEFADETFLTVDEQESGAITTLILQSCSLAGFRPHLCVAPDLETLLLWLELGRGIFALNEEHTIYLSNQIKTFELEEFPPITLSATWLKQTVNPCVSLLTGELPKLDEKLSLL